MNGLSRGIVWMGERLPVWAIVALVIGLNLYWTAVLNAFGAHFTQVSGQVLLDLQNVDGILSSAEAHALIERYSSEARTLYWIFFGLDNIFPPLVFGSFALLWVRLLRADGPHWERTLRRSPLLWLPLGVGFFDSIENLFFVTAITGGPAVDAFLYLQIGLVFVWLKAICLFATFIGTALLILYRGVAILRRWLSLPLRPQVE